MLHSPLYGDGEKLNLDTDFTLSVMSPIKRKNATVIALIDKFNVLLEQNLSTSALESIFLATFNEKVLREVDFDLLTDTCSSSSKSETELKEIFRLILDENTTAKQIQEQNQTSTPSTLNSTVSSGDLILKLPPACGRSSTADQGVSKKFRGLASLQSDENVHVNRVNDTATATYEHLSV